MDTLKGPQQSRGINLIHPAGTTCRLNFSAKLRQVLPVCRVDGPSKLPIGRGSIHSITIRRGDWQSPLPDISRFIERYDSRICLSFSIDWSISPKARTANIRGKSFMACLHCFSYCSSCRGSFLVAMACKNGALHLERVRAATADPTSSGPAMLARFFIRDSTTDCSLGHPPSLVNRKIPSLRGDQDTTNSQATSHPDSMLPVPCDRVTARLISVDIFRKGRFCTLGSIKALKLFLKNSGNSSRLAKKT
jgi:hypothetical protein